MRVKTPRLALILAIVYSMPGCAKTDAALTGASGGNSHNSATTTSFMTKPARVDFTTEIRPILEARCTPCHFAGGTMYERLPFDAPETIKRLGTKLFTRIKDEKSQRLIQEFLSQ